MLRYLLDINLCIHVLRDRPAGLRERFNAEASGLCISDVVPAVDGCLPRLQSPNRRQGIFLF